MRILWLFPPSLREGEFPLVSQNRWFKYLPEQTNNIFPILASYGMTMLQDAGHDVMFLDSPSLGLSSETICAMLDHERFDLVVLEGRTAIISGIHEWADKIHEISPQTKVAVYGDHVMVYPEESMRHVDFVINCGDYDFGVFRLAQELEKTRNAMENTIYTMPLASEKELDALPFVDRELVPWRSYFEAWRHRNEFGWVESSRGCPWSCTFCAWAEIFYNHTIRYMDVNRVLDEYECMRDSYGIREVLDDCDTYMQSYGVAQALEMKERGLDMFWNVQTRVDEIRDGSAWAEMVKQGLHVVKLGADGGSDHTLTMIKKGHTIKQTRDAVKKLKKAGCEIHINMILGYPWESKKDAYDVIKFVKSLRPNQAQFSLIEPFPGTEIYRQSLENSWFAVDPTDWTKWNMKQPILQGEMSAEEIKRLHKDAWMRFYFDPRYVAFQLGKSLELVFEERSLDSFRHLLRGVKGVRQNMKAME